MIRHQRLKNCFQPYNIVKTSQVHVVGTILYTFTVDPQYLEFPIKVKFSYAKASRRPLGTS